MPSPGHGKSAEPRPGHPLRVVFDTNVVVSALVFGGRLSWLRAAWRGGVVTPLVCRETAAELLRVVAYPKFRLAPAEREALLEDYLPYAEALALPAQTPELSAACRDRDDAVFIILALVAGADALVTGDADLKALRGMLPVPIMSASEFRSMLTSRPSAKPPSSLRLPK